MLGWLFLPEFDSRHRFLLFYSKVTFLPTVVLLVSLVLAFDGWRRLRVRFLDVPVVAVCVGAFFTSLSNGLGTYEAFAFMADQAMTWGAPYLLGRLYLGDPGSLRHFARAVVTGALVYVPLCLVEVRFSPQLHSAVYGFRTFGFDQAIRFGGYRPSVFVVHGLALGMFMAAATLLAFWTWRNTPRERFLGLPVGMALAVLSVNLLLTKSTGAIILCAAGVLTLESTRRLRTGALVLALAILPTVYCSSRIAGWDADEVAKLSDRIGEDRGASVRFRFANETRLVAKALQRPFLGWGRFGRSFLYDEEGRSLGAITDSLWIIEMGMAGLVGLAGTGLLLALAPLGLVALFPARAWGHPRLVAITGCATVVLLWAVDNLLNAMLVPIYPAMSGALVSIVSKYQSHVAAQRVLVPRRTGRTTPAPGSRQADRERGLLEGR